MSVFKRRGEAATSFASDFLGEPWSGELADRHFAFSAHKAVAAGEANTAPTLTNVTTTATVYEPPNSAPSLLEAYFLQNAVFSDPDGNFDGGRITITGLTAEDRITLAYFTPGGDPFIDLVGNSLQIRYGEVFGTWSGGDGTDLVITFNANATTALVDAVLNKLAYSTRSDTPSPQRTFYVNVTDAAGADLGPAAGGAPGQRGIAFTITINAIDDDPVLDLNGPGEYTGNRVDWAAGSAPVRIAPDATYGDPDGIGSGFGTPRYLTFGPFSFESGGLANGGAVTVVHEGMGAGQIGVQGTAIFYGGIQVATFDTAQNRIEFVPGISDQAVGAIVRQLAYTETSQTVAPGTRYLSLTLSDGVHYGAIESGVEITVTNGALDPRVPLVTPLDPIVNYDLGRPGAHLGSWRVQDGDSTTLVSAMVRITDGFQAGDRLFFSPQVNVGDITATYDPATGTLTLTAPSAQLLSFWGNALTSVYFANTAAGTAPGPRTISVQVTDPDGRTSPAATKTFQTIFVNDPPELRVIGNDWSGHTNYVEQADPVPLMPQATIVDPDSSHFGGGRLIVGYDTNVTPGKGDTIGIGAIGGISVSAGQVRFNGSLIGTATYGGGEALLTVALTEAATREAVQALLRAITYSNPLDNPPINSRFAAQLFEADGVASNGVWVSVGVQHVDDPASFDINGPADGTGSTTATYVVGQGWRSLAPDAVFADPDSPPMNTILRVRIVNPGAGDSLFVDTGPGVELADGGIIYQGYFMPLVAFSATEVALRLDFIPIDIVNEVVRSFGFSNDAPSGSMSRTISYTFSGSFNASATVQLTIDPNGLPAGQSLTGDGFVNHLFGGAGHDSITGGGGIDRLTGGLGNDRFVFTSVEDSRPYLMRSDGSKEMPDLIRDFYSGEDRIDLSAIDANSLTAENEAFIWIGQNAFSNQAGELRIVQENGAVNLYGDVNGDGIVDLHIAVFGDFPLVSDIIL